MLEPVAVPTGGVPFSELHELAPPAGLRHARRVLSLALTLELGAVQTREHGHCHAVVPARERLL